MATDTSKYFLVLLLGIAIGIFVGLMFLPPQIVNIQVPAQETIIRTETFIPAITILTIAALENKTIPEKVIITGAITENGSVTKVGAVAAKAKAVGERGYT